MAKKANTGRYSQAVFEIALERGELDRWQADLTRIAGLSEDTVFTLLMNNPKLHFNDKVSLLAERLNDINPLALNLAYLLVAKGKLVMAGEIASEYQRLLDSYRGIEQAEVITAVPLDDEDKQDLEKRLSAIVNKKIVIQSRVDPGIIGGIIARIDGKLLDGSTRSQLEALKREMSGVTR